jgi:hypothetical protein
LIRESTRLRVTRWLTVMDGGRMINAKTAKNQILGGIVMGIGMALFEPTICDPRNGHPINNNFADYIVPVKADIPEMDCISRLGVQRIRRVRRRRSRTYRPSLRASRDDIPRDRRTSARITHSNREPAGLNFRQMKSVLHRTSGFLRPN